MSPFCSKHFRGLAPSSPQSPSPWWQFMLETLGNSAPAAFSALTFALFKKSPRVQENKTTCCYFQLPIFSPLPLCSCSSLNLESSPQCRIPFLVCLLSKLVPFSNPFISLFFEALGSLATTRSMVHARDSNPLGHLRKDRHRPGGPLPGT